MQAGTSPWGQQQGTAAGLDSGEEKDTVLGLEKTELKEGPGGKSAHLRG